MKKFLLTAAIAAMAFGLPERATASSLDVRWMKQINRNYSRPLDVLFLTTSHSFYPVGVGVPTGMMIYGWKNDAALYDSGLIMEHAFLLTMTLNTAIKFMVRRPHPYEAYPDEVRKVEGDITSSFPSGHAAGTFAFALSASLEMPEWYVILPVYLWALATSYGRIYEGIHYPSDMIAGAIEGSAMAYLMHRKRGSILALFKRLKLHPEITEDKIAMSFGIQF